MKRSARSSPTSFAMKLITFYTPSHEPLARRLLASCVGEYRIATAVAEQRGKGVYHTHGWRATVLEKIKAIRREATEDFLFADPDVVFLRPSVERIRGEWRDLDCVFQFNRANCTGLFAMRSNAGCLRLLDRCIAELASDLENEARGDQAAMNRLLPSSGVRYGKLSGLFANPYTLTGGKWNGKELELPPETIAFHANWTVGVESKIRLIDMVLGGRESELLCGDSSPIPRLES